MALIGKIRRNPWILIVGIALGLGGFLIMDMVNAGQGPGGGVAQLVVGTVNGEKVRRADFEQVYGLRYNGSTAPTYQNRNNLWQWYTEDRVLAGEAENIGLGVSAEEMMDLEFGNNLSPIIQRNFGNPQQPGQVDREQLNRFKDIIENNSIEEEVAAGRLGPQFRSFWLMQREMIKKDRLQAKLQGMVTKALYTPTWMAEMDYTDQTQAIDFAYVKVPYDQIANDQVALSDSDLNAYLTANAPRYERKKEQRVMDYIAFDVFPTTADSTALRQKMVELAQQYRTTEDSDSNFVLRNEGIISPNYFTAEELSAAASDTLINMPAGSIYGPFIENGSYRIAKVIERHVVADSADTRHILLSAQTPDQFATVNERADSIITVLNNGSADFGELASRFSEDPGSKDNGGEYEGVTPNQFVPEFNKVLFITGTRGQLYKVRTNFGVHIVEILRRTTETTPRAMVSYIDEAIVPSKETQDDIFQRASQFIGNNRDLESMRAAAQEASDLRVVSAPAVDNTAYNIGQLGFSNDTKDAICWAFASYPGDVSPSVYTFTDQQRYYDNKYVVIGLNDIYEAGKPAVDEIRDELEAEVINQKKAEQLATTLSGSDLRSMAGAAGVAVDTASNVKFNSSTIAGLGNEPKVLAAAARLDAGQTSGVIEGNSGVFVIQVMSKPAIGQATNLPAIRNRLTTTARTVVPGSFMRFWVDNMEIEDNRSNFECN